MKHRFYGFVLAACLGCGATAEPAKPTSARPKTAAKARPKVKRALSPEQVQSTMRGQLASMAACYELSPSKQSEQAGELTVDFTVEANGSVSGESLTSDSFDDKVLRECVLGVVHKTAFPKSETPTDVSWPLRFGAR